MERPALPGPGSSAASSAGPWSNKRKASRELDTESASSPVAVSASRQEANGNHQIQHLSGSPRLDAATLDEREAAGLDLAPAGFSLGISDDVLPFTSTWSADVPPSHDEQRRAAQAQAEWTDEVDNATSTAHSTNTDTIEVYPPLPEPSLLHRARAGFDIHKGRYVDGSGLDFLDADDYFDESLWAQGRNGPRG